MYKSHYMSAVLQNMASILGKEKNQTFHEDCEQSSKSTVFTKSSLKKTPPKNHFNLTKCVSLKKAFQGVEINQIKLLAQQFLGKKKKIKMKIVTYIQTLDGP